MLDSMRSTAGSNSQMEQPRCFRFDITWSSLTGDLKLREVTDSTPVTQTKSSVLVPAVVPPDTEKPAKESTGRWEMVVPKMNRTGQKTFPPARSLSTVPQHSPYPRPMFANFEAEPLF